MDKLRIGIYTETNAMAMVGGGFSYVEALVEAIDAYEFDPALEFRFIQVEAQTFFPNTRKALRINPNARLSGKARWARAVNNRLFHRTKNFFGLGHNLQKRYASRFEKAYRHALEAELDHHKIDLLYYLKPEFHQLRRPYVYTHWDMGHRSMFPFPEVAQTGEVEARERMVAETIHRAFAVCSETDTGKEELIQYAQLNPNRVFVVPLFPGKVVTLQPTNDQQQEVLRRFGLAANRYFFYPAQFWPHKNHYNLLVAFKKLGQPHLKLVLTGADMGNRSYIAAVAQQLGLGNQVVMPGLVPHEEITTLYCNACALVMPTFLGPSNMPLLEAEALGCPVICTELPGHRELLGNGAKYINPTDAEAICQAMATCLTEPRPVARTNPRFNVQNAVKQIEATFLALKPIRKSFGLSLNAY